MITEKKKCKQELQILRAVCGTDCGASDPAVPASLGVAFKVSLLAGASFVLSQRPLDRGRPIFGSKESCLPRSVLHLSKEQKSSWRGQCWVSLPRSFQLFQIPGFTSVTYAHFKGKTGLDHVRSFSLEKDDFLFRGLDIYQDVALNISSLQPSKESLLNFMLKNAYLRSNTGIKPCS